MSICLHWNLHLFIVNINITFWANIFRVIAANNCTNVQWPESCQLCLAPDCDGSFIQNPYPISMQVTFIIHCHYFFQNKEDLCIIFPRDCHNFFYAWELWQEPVTSCVDSYTFLILCSMDDTPVCPKKYIHACLSKLVGSPRTIRLQWHLYMFESSTKKYSC